MWLPSCDGNTSLIFQKRKVVQLLGIMSFQNYIEIYKFPVTETYSSTVARQALFGFPPMQNYESHLSKTSSSTTAKHHVVFQM